MISIGSFSCLVKHILSGFISMCQNSTITFKCLIVSSVVLFSLFLCRCTIRKMHLFPNQCRALGPKPITQVNFLHIHSFWWFLFLHSIKSGSFPCCSHITCSAHAYLPLKPCCLFKKHTVSPSFHLFHCSPFWFLETQS